MSKLSIALFNRLRIEHRQRSIERLKSQKVEELLCFILIQRRRPVPREKIAGLLWPESSASRAKQYLRQTLWQLQSTLYRGESPERPLLKVDNDWIQVNPAADLWLDVEEFESAFNQAKEVDGTQLDAEEASRLKAAVQLYRGDLLEDWYQDWCVFERERLQNIYLSMLDKLVGYCEATCAHETGLIYGTKILECDRAHERTYRRLMRLFLSAGDRTRALRLFQRCRKVLQEELGVEPSRKTRQLHREIQTSDPGPRLRTETESKLTMAADSLRRLKQLRDMLVEAQKQVEREIDQIRKTLADAP